MPNVLDEQAWLPKLEAIGFRLIFRDLIAGDAHRQLTLGEPNTNLHVWRPDAVEPQRHRLFVEWLRDHPDDRQAYANAKAKAIAEPNHAHDPHPGP